MATRRQRRSKRRLRAFLAKPEAGQAGRWILVLCARRSASYREALFLLRWPLRVGFVWSCIIFPLRLRIRTAGVRMNGRVGPKGLNRLKNIGPPHMMWIALVGCIAQAAIASSHDGVHKPQRRLV